MALYELPQSLARFPEVCTRLSDPQSLPAHPPPEFARMRAPLERSLTCRKRAAAPGV